MKIRLMAVCAGTLLLATAPASHALQCSVHVAKGTAAAKLPQLAKVSKEQAEKIAIGAVGSSARPTASEGELEVEHECLVYSFDLQVPGQAGVEEVMVDAGNGKVLSHTHETAKHEAAERAADERSRNKSAGHQRTP
jgi:Peptidase propeptide and YPEB domain